MYLNKNVWVTDTRYNEYNSLYKIQNCVKNNVFYIIAQIENILFSTFG